MDRGVGRDHAIKDRFAVFMLANLQVWRVFGGFDKVSGGIDQKQALIAALALPADHDRGCTALVMLFKRIMVFQLDLLHGLTNKLGNTKHAGRAKDAIARCGLWIVDGLMQSAHDGLCDRKVASRKCHNRAVTRNFPGKHLAIARNVIKASIRAGIRKENQSFFQHQTDAVGHVLMGPAIVVIAQRPLIHPNSR